MSDNINSAIINLLEKKVINATSCMPNMPAFKLGIAQLKKYIMILVMLVYI
ncbi:ydjC-like family protein [Francisella tularensis]|nr:ydjC-like family protein [Francisella tularensis]